MSLIKKEKYNKTYSQSGEDVIVNFLFEAHNIPNPSYIDIGANDPFVLSNTALFYEKGCRGINIEPNPVLCENLKKWRKKDINLNIGVGESDGSLVFYLMNSPTMSTFSEDNAKELVDKHGFRVEKAIDVEVMSLKTIISKYCDDIFPDFLSLDAEGLDMEILKTIDYDKSYPKVICVETMEYATDFSGKKDQEIIDFLCGKGYRVYADTYINTIFERF